MKAIRVLSKHQSAVSLFAHEQEIPIFWFEPEENGKLYVATRDKKDLNALKTFVKKQELENNASHS